MVLRYNNLLLNVWRTALHYQNTHSYARSTPQLQRNKLRRCGKDANYHQYVKHE